MRICVVTPPEECLRVKADMVQCDPYLRALEALEAFAKTRYTNRRHVYLYLYNGRPFFLY